MIRQSTVMDGAITEFIAEGAISAEDVIKVIEEKYAAIKKHVLWNLLDGDMSSFSRTDMQRVAMAAKQHSVHEKTAFLGASDFTFAMLRMYRTHSEIEKVPLQMQVFRDRQEAIDWLQKDSA